MPASVCGNNTKICIRLASTPTKLLDSGCPLQKFDLFERSKVFVKIHSRQDGVLLTVEIDLRHRLSGVRHGDVQLLSRAQSAAYDIIMSGRASTHNLK